MTQEELAEKAGINASYIGTVERGERNISIETLEKIIEGLGVSSAAMFQFHETDSLDIASEKAEVLESISSLYSRTLSESKLLFRVLKDIVDTMDHREN